MCSAMISTLQSVTLPSSVHPHIRANTVGDQIEDVLLQQQQVCPGRGEEGGPFNGQRDGRGSRGATGCGGHRG